MRHAVRAALLAAITTAVNDTAVLIDYGWPGSIEAKDMIWLGPSSGKCEVPVFRGQASSGNPIIIDDEFDIPINIYAGSVGSSFAAAEARADALYDLIRTYVCATPALGIMSTANAVMQYAVMSGLDGPHTGQDPAGPASWFTATVLVRTREQ